MYNTLYIFDVMPFVHAGNWNKHSKLEYLVDSGSRCYSVVIPTGGVSLIFNELYHIVGTGDIVFCCDRNPTIKKDMYPAYKEHREHNEEIGIASKVAEYILELCNGTLLHAPGYEADDFIYTIVKKYHDVYDRIYVYTGDSDLYFLVDEKVSIRPSSSTAKSVDMNNYSKVIKKGTITRYNTTTFAKICCGDSSDNIPALPTPWLDKMATIMYSDAMVGHLGDKEFVKYWVSKLCPEALGQVDLVFPLDVPDIELPNEFSEMSKTEIRNIGAAINNKMYRGTGDSGYDVSPVSEELYRRGCYLEEQQR